MSAGIKCSIYRERERMRYDRSDICRKAQHFSWQSLHSRQPMWPAGYSIYIYTYIFIIHIARLINSRSTSTSSRQVSATTSAPWQTCNITETETPSYISRTHIGRFEKFATTKKIKIGPPPNNRTNGEHINDLEWALESASRRVPTEAHNKYMVAA